MINSAVEIGSFVQLPEEEEGDEDAKSQNGMTTGDQEVTTANFPTPSRNLAADFYKSSAPRDSSGFSTNYVGDQGDLTDGELAHDVADRKRFKR